MKVSKIPKHYKSIKERFPEISVALEELGKTLRKKSSLDDKTAHLVQLAAAAAIHSEGSVHSHARRALQAGATTDELYHAALLLISTIGFPRAAAAISWIDETVGR